jgi:3-phenylpropionate/trans-cinnamate dioxygenase ferredoxin subunit
VFDAHSTADPGESLFRINGGPAGDEAIAIAVVEGRAFAFQDRCTHQSCSLSDGFLDEYAVICPCHHSVFDVRDGQVLIGPARTPLQTYDCALDGNGVSVGALRPMTT